MKWRGREGESERGREGERERGREKERKRERESERYLPGNHYHPPPMNAGRML